MPNDPESEDTFRGRDHNATEVGDETTTPPGSDSRADDDTQCDVVLAANPTDDRPSGGASVLPIKDGLVDITDFKEPEWPEGYPSEAWNFAANVGYVERNGRTPSPLEICQRGEELFITDWNSHLLFLACRTANPPVTTLPLTHVKVVPDPGEPIGPNKFLKGPPKGMDQVTNQVAKTSEKNTAATTKASPDDGHSKETKAPTTEAGPTELPNIQAGKRQKKETDSTVKPRPAPKTVRKKTRKKTTHPATDSKPASSAKIGDEKGWKEKTTQKDEPLPKTTSEPTEESKTGRKLVTVPVAILTPNNINSEIFSASLGKESIADLAEDIARSGLRDPLPVNEDLTILDGHRRYLALGLLGVEEVDVYVVKGRTEDDQIEEFVVDAATSQRKMTAEERVNLYHSMFRVLQRRHGGKRNDRSQNANESWSGKRIRKESARQVGFSSYSNANRADFVFREGDDELKKRVNSEKISISAAYDRIQKQKKKAAQEQAESAKTKDDTKTTTTTAADKSTDEKSSSKETESETTPTEASASDDSENGHDKTDQKGGDTTDPKKDGDASNAKKANRESTQEDDEYRSKQDVDIVIPPFEGVLHPCMSWGPGPEESEMKALIEEVKYLGWGRLPEFARRITSAAGYHVYYLGDNALVSLRRIFALEHRLIHLALAEDPARTRAWMRHHITEFQTVLDETPKADGEDDITPVRVTRSQPRRRENEKKGIERDFHAQSRPDDMPSRSVRIERPKELDETPRKTIGRVRKFNEQIARWGRTRGRASSVDEAESHHPGPEVDTTPDVNPPPRLGEDEINWPD